MTLDTYTHLFEQAAHGADVRAELARSEFANLLTPAVAPRLHGRGARAATRRVPRLRRPSPVTHRGACAAERTTRGSSYLTKT
jgi:hypothetical protein